MEMLDAQQKEKEKLAEIWVNPEHLIFGMQFIKNGRTEKKKLGRTFLVFKRTMQAVIILIHIGFIEFRMTSLLWTHHRKTKKN